MADQHRHLITGYPHKQMFLFFFVENKDQAAFNMMEAYV
jgi:hypothetical protein